MYTFQGIAVNAGASIDGDCSIAHTVDNEGIEVNIGSGTGGLNLNLSADAAVKLTEVVTLAVTDLRQRHTIPDRSEHPRDER